MSALVAALLAGLALGAGPVDAQPGPDVPLGGVGGTVTELGTATPLSGITVQLYNGATLQSTTSTDGSGRYSFTASDGTDYRVRFVGTSLYAGEYAHDAPNLSSATPVAVAGTTTTVDEQLARKSTLAAVTGTYTDGVTGDPAPALTVTLYRDGVATRYAMTGADGSFAVTNLDPTGTWTARVHDTANTYRPIFHDQRMTLHSADAIVLAAGTTTDVSAPVWKWSDTAWISGTVRDASTGQIIVGAEVRAFASNGRVVFSTTTESDGTYRFGGLIPGSYRIRASDPDYRLRWWKNRGVLANATPIVIAANDDIVADITLQPTSIAPI